MVQYKVNDFFFGLFLYFSQKSKDLFNKNHAVKAAKSSNGSVWKTDFFAYVISQKRSAMLFMTKQKSKSSKHHKQSSVCGVRET